MAADVPARIRVTTETSAAARGLAALDRGFTKLAEHTQRTYDRLLGSLGRKFRDLPQSIGRAAINVPKSFGKGLKGVGKAGLGALKEMGVGALRDAGAGLLGAAQDGARATVDFERAMTRFSISGDVSKEGMHDLRQSIMKVSEATGINREQLISGAAAYLGLTGDAAGATSQIGLFGKIALATGAEMGDIATAAASLRDNLKIDPANFEQAFSALIVQGKAGAIELKDLASELSGIAPLFTSFKGGSGMEGLATLGAALQAGRKGFGTASQAVTGLQSLIVSLNRNAGKFTGVKLFKTDPRTGVKTMKGFREIIDAISTSRLAKDPTALVDAFGSVEAKRFYDQLVQNRGMLDELEQKSKEGGAVQADAMAYQASAAGQMEIAMNKMMLAISKAFTPELIQTFAKAVGDVAKLVGVVVEGLTAITEFAEVRDTANRNERQLAEMGEYTGDDRDLQHINRVALQRQFVEEQRQAPFKQMQRAQKLLDIAGPGELTLDQRSTAETGVLSDYERRRAISTGVPKVQTELPQQHPVSRLAPTPLPPIVLQVDGTALATSVSNARQSRREVSPR